MKKDGNFVHTLTVTDIHSGWTECAALAVREQSLVVEGLSAIARVLPFALSGLDTDNDSAFMNETLQSYCNQHRIEWTRSRAYHKNDQAWVEQKNGAVVRRLAGYGRLSGLAAASRFSACTRAQGFTSTSSSRRSSWRASNAKGQWCISAIIRRSTPYQRLLASDAVDETVKQRLREQFAVLDPVALLKTIRGVQQELLALSNHEINAADAPAQPEYFDAFATAWHSDYRAPKERRKTTTKHWWRTRADPFAESWPLVEGWLMAEPNLTAKELLTRLSQRLPDLYPTGAQLRTLQRRVKAWRTQWARQLVFAATADQQAHLEAKAIA